MKKLVVVLGLSAIAMAGKCSSSEEKPAEAAKVQEEFPVKEEAQAPAEEVPSYEQEEAQPADGAASPAPAETTP
ncbi:MAG: hypothetical protein NTX25_13735 [Proteobacteria bacterium]|nr:hypothetical protein [Pseudomonadota bacterium]